MAFEVIMGPDLRIIVSHKKQSAYGTYLPHANFETGMAIRLNTATVGDVSILRSPGTPRAGSHTEFPVADNERKVGQDSKLSIAMDCESFMAGWGLAFLMGGVASAQEGATTHWTHTFTCTDPLSASGRNVLITSAYLDTGGPDGTRLIRIIPDLTPMSLSLSGKGKDVVQLAIEMVGSGRETTDQILSPFPALMTQTLYANDGVKLEVGAKGGGLTDFTERLSEWSISFHQELALDQGYYPGSGYYRGRLWFIRRFFTIDFALYASRANRDFIDDMLLRTLKEVKITIDSGVVPGTGTGTHKIVARYPSCRFSEAPMVFNPEGALYQVKVADDQVYIDSAIAASPCTVVVDNVQSAYLAAP